MTKRVKPCPFCGATVNKSKGYGGITFFDWHGKLTGSCEMGRRSFAQDNGIDLEKDMLTVERFVELTKSQYGGEIIKKIERK